MCECGCSDGQIANTQKGIAFLRNARIRFDAQSAIIIIRFSVRFPLDLTARISSVCVCVCVWHSIAASRQEGMAIATLCGLALGTAHIKYTANYSLTINLFIYSPVHLIAATTHAFAD